MNIIILLLSLGDAIATNSASFTAYVIRPTSPTGTSGTTLFSAPMNLNTTMTSYSASYNGYVESGNKGMKFTGSSGNVSFTPTFLFGRKNEVKKFFLYRFK